MKKIGLFVVVIIASVSAFAAIIIAVGTSGDWNTPSTWNLGRVPQNGDTILIPAGDTVTIGKYTLSLTHVYLDIEGTLYFTNNAGHVGFDTSSYITIGSKGIITSDISNSSDFLDWGKTTVYKSGNGGTGPVTGPAHWGTPPPSGAPLPVLFASFSLAHDQSNVLLQWSTAFESNSKAFEIDRSTDGINWATIGAVRAAGNSSMPLSYSYTDQNVSGSSIFYYRVKEVDLDNQLVYTNVKSIRLDNNSPEVKIVYISKNNLFVNFSQQIKGNVLMRLVSSSGQLVFQQTVSNPIGQVNILAKNHAAGIYILTISNGKGLSISKQVLF